MWMELTALMCKNPLQARPPPPARRHPLGANPRRPPSAGENLRVEAIIRWGLRTFTDEAGHLWCALADYFLRQAQFEQARDMP